MNGLASQGVPPGGNVHLVGIGGAGMSAIARVLRESGYEVSGSDQRESAVLGALRGLGVTVEIGHRPRRVEGADLVVASAAVPEDNVELMAARDAGIPVVPGVRLSPCWFRERGRSPLPARMARRPPRGWSPRCCRPRGSTQPGCSVPTWGKPARGAPGTG